MCGFSGFGPWYKRRARVSITSHSAQLRRKRLQEQQVDAAERRAARQAEEEATLRDTMMALLSHSPSHSHVPPPVGFIGLKGAKSRGYKGSAPLTPGPAAQSQSAVAVDEEKENESMRRMMMSSMFVGLRDVPIAVQDFDE